MYHSRPNKRVKSWQLRGHHHVYSLGKETVRLFDLENGSTIGELESVDDWGVHPMGLIVDEVNNRIITTRSYMGIDF